MASAWGKSWGMAFGAAFGALAQAVPPVPYPPGNASGAWPLAYAHATRPTQSPERARTRKRRDAELLWMHRL